MLAPLREAVLCQLEKYSKNPQGAVPSSMSWGTWEGEEGGANTFCWLHYFSVVVQVSVVAGCISV